MLDFILYAAIVAYRRPMRTAWMGVFNMISRSHYSQDAYPD